MGRYGQGYHGHVHSHGGGGHGGPSVGTKRRRHDDAPVPTVPSAAFTRAYEAQLVRGRPPAARLIRCGDSDVWADRHDILHLIDSLPSPCHSNPPSPTWSTWSLPSDAEETFTLSGDEEMAAHAEAKRRHWVTDLREARLREREREDEEQVKAKEREEERVGNEPPTPDILKLMEHTARALAASPNPAALEMRILARQSGDRRFAFLRTGGESSAVWGRIKAGTMEAMGVNMSKAGSRATAIGSGSSVATKAQSSIQTQPQGLGGLMGYDTDSDSDTERDEGDHPQPPEPEGSPPPPPPPPPDSPPPPPPGPPP